MSQGSSAIPRELLERSRSTKKRRLGPLWLGLAVLIALPASLWFSGIVPNRLWSKTTRTQTLVLVDVGDVPLFVVESGALESANNATVKVRVEALLGQVGGQQGMGPGNRAGGRPRVPRGPASSAAALPPAVGRPERKGELSRVEAGAAQTAGPAPPRSKPPAYDPPRQNLQALVVVA